jgi:hypothetical protein
MKLALGVFLRRGMDTRLEYQNNMLFCKRRRMRKKMRKMW